MGQLVAVIPTKFGIDIDRKGKFEAISRYNKRVNGEAKAEIKMKE